MGIDTVPPRRGSLSCRPGRHALAIALAWLLLVPIANDVGGKSKPGTETKPTGTKVLDTRPAPNPAELRVERVRAIADAQVKAREWVPLERRRQLNELMAAHEQSKSPPNATEPVKAGTDCCLFARKPDASLQQIYERAEAYVRASYFERHIDMARVSIVATTHDTGSLKLMQSRPSLRKHTKGQSLPDLAEFEAHVAKMARAYPALLERPTPTTEAGLDMAQVKFPNPPATVIVLGHHEGGEIVFHRVAGAERTETWRASAEHLYAIGRRHGVQVLVWGCETAQVVSGGVREPFSMRPMLEALDAVMTRGRSLTYLEFFQLVTGGEHPSKVTLQFDAISLLRELDGMHPTATWAPGRTIRVPFAGSEWSSLPDGWASFGASPSSGMARWYDAPAKVARDNHYLIVGATVLGAVTFLGFRLRRRAD